MFQVEFDNQKQDNYYLTLKDNDGETLYGERFKEKKFSRKFLLNAPDQGKLVVSFASKNDDLTQVFSINKKSFVVEDVTVTRIK